MTTLLAALPALAGLAALLVRRDRPRRALLVGTAAGHATLTAACWARPLDPEPGAWLGLDAPGLLFLSLVSALFLAAAVYAVHYLAAEDAGARVDFEEGGVFSNAPEARFTGCLLLFLSTMSAACLSRNFGLFWVATEATTLASAPLIFFHR
ncbi:MAG: NADH dehydrogenase FAD-containing subunit, partial [Elusimicrobia bacterium]|nr:NADH dehydrogenase FAD-containing subunit [Elusimicrobiota bacterium]